MLAEQFGSCGIGWGYKIDKLWHLPAANGEIAAFCGITLWYIPGVSVAAFTLAVERSFARAGEQRQADFIEVVAWRSTAEFVCRYFQKGSMIAVDGSIQTRTYQDKNGNTRKAFEVVTSNVHFAGSKEKNHSGDANRMAESPSYPQPNDDFEVISGDEDLPF